MGKKGKLEALHAESRTKAAQKLKKIIKMKGTHPGAFLVIPMEGKNYFFLDEGKTAAIAAGRIKGALSNFSRVELGDIVCGTVSYKNDVLSLTIQAIGGMAPKVKTTSNLKKILKKVGTGNLKLLKDAELGAAAEDSDEIGDIVTPDAPGTVLPLRTEPMVVDYSTPSASVPTPEMTTVIDFSTIRAGISASDRKAIDDIVLSEEDEFELAQFISDAALQLDKLRAPVPTLAEREGWARVLAALHLTEQGNTVAVDSEDAFQEALHGVAKANAGIAFVWSSPTLALHLMESSGFQAARGSSSHLKMVELLDTVRCEYTIAKQPVKGKGLDKYNNPVNHGLIIVKVGSKKHQIEKSAAATKKSIDIETNAISYTQLCNLLASGYSSSGYLGGETLIARLGHEQQQYTRKGLYRAFVNDCWTYIEHILNKAGLDAPTNQRVIDKSNFKKWMDSSLGAKFLRNVLGTVIPVLKKEDFERDMEERAVS